MPVPAIHAIEAELIEIFSSIQGEGLLVGARQIFIRFAQCNLSCNYCDTDFKLQPACKIESNPGTGKFVDQRNPIDLNDISDLIEKWQINCKNMHHSVVLTGGEPLLHADVLQTWLPDVVPLLPIYLETNGTLPAHLEKVIDFIDMISMDIKGKAVTGFVTPWDIHSQFMSIGSEKLFQVKLVVDSSTSESEVMAAAQFVYRNAPHVPFVLQPRTINTKPALNGETILKFQKLAAEQHGNVRVIPQIHSWLGIA